MDADPDTKLPVGTPIVVMVESKNDVNAFTSLDKSLFSGDSSAGATESTSSVSTEAPKTEEPKQLGRVPSIRFRYGVRG